MVFISFVKATDRMARSAMYPSPSTSSFTPCLLWLLSAMNAPSANSSSVMSDVSCSFPLSPNGFAMDMCKTNVCSTSCAMLVNLQIQPLDECISPSEKNVLTKDG